MDNPRKSDSAFPTPRRVFTAPSYAGSSSEQTSSTPGGGLVETLYNHPSVKIVAFNAGPRPVFNRGKGIASDAEIEPGSLPWSSQLERTIAAGQFRIYRAPGSVAFLSCGSALQPILPKSQCWCVDEASSKYILQIRRPQYWRIEVPVGNEDEARRALELRAVLDHILQLEKTECPFKRGFTVELPERPQTPVKKRPWTPVSRKESTTVLPPSPMTPADIAPAQRAREEVPPSSFAENAAELIDKVSLSAECKAEDSTADPPGLSDERREGDSPVAGKVEDVVSALEHIAQRQKDTNAARRNSRPAKPGGFQTNRSVTAPPQLTIVTAPASKDPGAAPEKSALIETVTENSGLRSPTDSEDGFFHSVESWTSPGAPLPPSPPLTASGSPTVTPFSQEHLHVAKNAQQHDAADLTVTPNTPQTVTGESSDERNSHHEEPTTQATLIQDDSVSSACSAPPRADESLQLPISTTQTELSSAPAVNSTEVSPPTSATIACASSASLPTSPVLARQPYMRSRPTTSSSISPSRGALNRVPSAADLFPSYRSTSYSTTATQSRPSMASSRLSLVRQLPRTIIHKTIEILLSPPSHLIDLMLKVAARIAAGEWRGYVSGVGEGGERIPVRWDWSDGDDDGEGELGGWGADEDWEFSRAGRRDSVFRMAGAYPDSPEDDEAGNTALGPGEVGVEVPESPSLRRRKGRAASRDGREAEKGSDDDDAKDAADGNADWTGSLSID